MNLFLDVCYSGQVPAIMAELVCLLVCMMYNYGGGFSNFLFYLIQVGLKCMWHEVYVLCAFCHLGSVLQIITCNYNHKHKEN